MLSEPSGLLQSVLVLIFMIFWKLLDYYNNGDITKKVKKKNIMLSKLTGLLLGVLDLIN